MSEPRSASVPDKYRVRITVISRQQDERVEQTSEGDLYLRGSSIYLRYHECTPDPRHVKRRSGSDERDQANTTNTSVMLKMNAQEWKLTRDGAVRSEMTFALGSVRTGRYLSETLSFPLETRTHRMHRQDEPYRLEGGQELMLPKTVRWSYDLYIEEQCTGQFDIELQIVPLSI